MTKRYKIVIPARYSSSRLPGKPLLDIAGKPMIQHTWERACETQVDNADIYIATDDERVFDAVIGFGGNAVMTSSEHPSGTDRLAEVALGLQWDENDIIVNVQGDEPLIEPEYIELAAQSLLQNSALDIATLATPIYEIGQLIDPNTVKVVCDITGKALYFSRATIPFDRDNMGFDDLDIKPLRHIGLYAYRVSSLLSMSRSPSADIENLECLEQLRALYQGMAVHVTTVSASPAPGVDTAEDLEKVRALFAPGSLHTME